MIFPFIVLACSGNKMMSESDSSLSQQSLNQYPAEEWLISEGTAISANSGVANQRALSQARSALLMEIESLTVTIYKMIEEMEREMNMSSVFPNFVFSEGIDHESFWDQQGIEIIDERIVELQNNSSEAQISIALKKEIIPGLINERMFTRIEGDEPFFENDGIEKFRDVVRESL